jgi:phage tail sheath protein FI
MSSELSASRVVVVEQEPRVRGINAAATSIAAAVGTTERGPANQPILCASFDDFVTSFGGFAPNADLPLTVKGFFENGGSQLWASRVVSGTAVEASADLIARNPVAPTPAILNGTRTPPFDVGNSDYLNIRVLSYEAFVEDWTLPIATGLPAWVTSTKAQPYSLTDGMTLELFVNGVFQTVPFLSSEIPNINAASRSSVLNVLTTYLSQAFAFADGSTFRIQSVVRGSSSSIIVTGGTARTALGLVGASGFGSGTFPDYAAVTIQDLADAAASYEPAPVDFLTGPGGVLQIRSRQLGGGVSFISLGGSYIREALGIPIVLTSGTGGEVNTFARVFASGPGDYGNDLSVEIAASTSGTADTFDLIVWRDDVQLERFPDLSRDPGRTRFIEAVVNDAQTGSGYVRISAFPPFTGFPAGIDVYPLEGGRDGAEIDDGIDTPGDADYIGSEASGTGLHAFDNVPDINMLLVPGRATPAVHNAMVAYCEQHRDGNLFAILDPPAGMSASQIVTYVSTTASLENLSECGAIYWPRVTIASPNKAIYGSDPIVVPPSGIIAGLYARTDAARPGGVYEPPAGIERGRLVGVLGFETDDTLNVRKRDLVYPHRINPITTAKGLPKYVDGSRTLKGDGNFGYVAERRGVTFIEQSLRQGLQFARHRNNTPELRAEVRRTITAFLLVQTQNGAFRSREPSKAFFVDVSDEVNPPSVVSAGTLVARIGLATNKPAEYVVLEISQDTRALEEELAAAE